MKMAVGWRKLLIPCLLATALLNSGCVRPASQFAELQFSIWGSRQQLAIEQSIIAAFEAENPHIRIRVQAIGQRYAEKIQAMLVGNAAPDVMLVEMSNYDEWSSRGQLIDVSDEVARVTENNPLMPVPRRAFERDGHFFALPINASGQAMYCNVDAFKAAGLPLPTAATTWEDVLSWNEKLSKRAGDPDAPVDYLLLMPDYRILFNAYGAGLFDQADHPQVARADTPEVRTALQVLRRIRNLRGIVPNYIAEDQGTYQLFRDGKVALFFSGRWMTPEFAGKTAFEWDVAPLPQGTAGNISLHGGTGLAIWKNTRHEEAARKFLRFYASKKSWAAAMRGGRYIPVYRPAAYSPEFLALRPPASIRIFVDTMEENASQLLFYGPGQAEVERIVDEYVQRALSTRLPIEQITGDLQQDLARWMKQRQEKQTTKKS